MPKEKILKLNVELLITPDEWELIQSIYGNVADTKFVTQYQEEHGSVTALVNDPHAFLYEYVSMYFNPGSAKLYANQRKRFNEINNDVPF